MPRTPNRVFDTTSPNCFNDSIFRHGFRFVFEDEDGTKFYLFTHELVSVEVLQK